MKKINYLLGAILISLSANAQTDGQSVQSFNKTTSITTAINQQADTSEDGMTPTEILACPEGTVLSGEFQENQNNSLTTSDWGRTDITTVVYQQFLDCFQTVNSIRFLGVFKYFDGTQWIDCNERGGIDENYEMTEEIPFEIAFYQMNDEGMPGEEIYRKTINVLGKYTGLVLDQTPLYSFTADLGEDIKLYKGYFSIAAAKETEEPATCWFQLFGTNNVYWPAYICYVNEGGEMVKSQTPICFCLMGDGSYSAQKALDLFRILSPNIASDQKYEKVQVEVSNIGQESINGINLELWVDGKFVTKETADIELPPMDMYKYTFSQRVDCSDRQKHKIEVRNVTPGCENISSDRLSVSVIPAEYGETGSLYSDIYDMHIASVKIGDIDNTSGCSGYSDYTDMKTEITIGDTLVMTLGYGGAIKPSAYGVWVDWNGNQSFEDEKDIITMANTGENDTVKIAIPADIKGINIKGGETRLRVCAVYGGTPSPSGYYNFGETEDYTLIVNRNDDSPIFEIDNLYVEKESDPDITDEMALNIKNNGNGSLEGNIVLEYALPYSTNINHITDRAPAKDYNAKPCYAPAKSSKMPEAEDAEFVLKYDKGQKRALSMGMDTIAYAVCYTGEALSSIKGMEIKSIDVYIQDPAKENYLAIYGEDRQNRSGELIARQKINPTPNSWNTITLDNPIVISGEDLWISAEFLGCKSNSYQIGVDDGDAANGFGALLPLEDNYWLPLPNIEANHNFCIRANVYGKRTPAISWINIDKNNYQLSAQNNETITLGINTTGLRKTLYEAVLNISSNDPFCNEIRVPVYLICTEDGGICLRQSSNTFCYIEAGELKIESEKDIRQITIYNASGISVISSDDKSVNISSLSKGTYIVIVEYNDGNTECSKVII